ncbi:phosphoglucosamine mutase [Eubacteriaceae bacterium ES2]|nr:phosphoglucosamine mutase [Eubacteriaceae bacterium ES2]
MGKLFGTDGVRGVFNEELTLDLANKLGQAGAKVLGNNAHQPKIVIGMDTRSSGPLLEQALIDGIVAVGGLAISVGVIPTPAVAVLTRELKADAGIVISASHNPAKYNGIKFFNQYGFKLADEVENEIERLVLEEIRIEKNANGKQKRHQNPDQIYTNHLKKANSGELNGVKMVLDCANGAASHIAPDFFRSLGAEVVALGDQPDGQNINHNCGSTHLEGLIKMVLETGADIGIALDGDADRCLAVDNAGNAIDGDQILNLIAGQLKSENRLKHDTAVVTVMSNIGLDLAFESQGLKTVKTDVGDRYVLERMQADDYNLGGEQSGHLILLDYNTTGDGMLTALALLEILKKEDRDMQTLGQLMTVFPQVLVNARVPNTRKKDYLTDEIIQKQIRAVEAHFHGKGRVLIRPSGTEPLVRVMIEGENQAELNQIASDLAVLIESRLN